MKKWMSILAVALALVLALVMGMVAVAENADDADNEAELPAVEELQPAAPEAEEQAPEAQAPEAAEAQDSSDDAALKEAMEALQKARQGAHEDSLQAELDGYVAAGTLTQEQADLIMQYYRQRQSLRNGTCPECGYQFGNGQTKGGRGFGRGNGQGNGQGNGKGSRGGRRGMGLQGFGSMPGTTDGMQQTPDMQAGPQMNAFNGI